MATTTPPPGMGLASFTEWWGTEYPKAQNDWNVWTNKIGTAKASLSAWQDQYTPISWASSNWGARDTQLDTGLGELSQKIKDYNWDTTNPEMGKYVAGLNGMTPEQYASLQQEYNVNRKDNVYAAQSDASAAAAYLETIANSEFGKQQDKTDRIALRQMEDDIGKRLESIFGERGGMGGFQASYELTSQMQNVWMQNKQNTANARFDQAVTAVNANNGYFQQMLDQGKLSGQEYLNLRYQQLKDGYENYLTEIDQNLREWQTVESVSAQQREEVETNLQQQIDNMTDQMTREMGGYTTLGDYIKSLYDIYTQPIKDLDAQLTEKADANRATGTALLTTGATIAGAGVVYAGSAAAAAAATAAAATGASAAAISAGAAAAAIPVVGWIVGGALLLVGLGFLIFGGSAPDTRTPEQKAAAEAAANAQRLENRR